MPEAGCVPNLSGEMHYDRWRAQFERKLIARGWLAQTGCLGI
jgi:hypothetical protein